MFSNNAVKAVILSSLLVLAGLVPLHANAACQLVSTKDGSPLDIKVTAEDTPEAKEFLATCVNPYTKRAMADADVAKTGKKLFGYWSCTQCHGGNAGGQTGPSATDATWQYSKHITDKGIFETVAGGSNAGMPTWHAQPAANTELLKTDEILRIIGWLRTMYVGGGDKPWLNETPQK